MTCETCGAPTGWVAGGSLQRANESKREAMTNALALMEEVERLKKEVATYKNDSALMTKELILERDRRAVELGRLKYCYDQMNTTLVKPLMTYDEWIAAIDKEISK